MFARWYFFVLYFAFASFGCNAFSHLDEREWGERRDSFRRDGYLWIKQFYSPEQVLLLRNWAEAAFDSSQMLLSLSQQTGYSLQSMAQEIQGALIVVPEASDPSKVCRAEDLLSCFPDFHQFVYGTLTTYLGRLMEEPFTLFKDKINFKWPGGGAFPPHQDFPAYENFGPREHITVMVCIDRATLENGCLQVAKFWKETFSDDPKIGDALKRGENGVLPYIVGGSKHGTIEPDYIERIEWVPVEAEPGDVVFFDSYLPHYSEPNRSETPRRALFLTHNRLREGDHRKAYYHMKRADPDNPVFHFATPTKARGK